MAITTEEFEQRLNDLLTKMEGWPRCEWCGCDDRQRRIAPNSKLCDSCKEWRRREGRAKEWIRKNPSEEWKREHPGIAREEQYMRVEYEIEYAALCRQEGQIRSLKKYVAPLDLESELRLISERFCGEDIFGHTTYYFEHFSEAQRRLLMFLLKELTKVSVRHRRRSVAINNVLKRRFPSKSSLP